MTHNETDIQDPTPEPTPEWPKWATVTREHDRWVLRHNMWLPSGQISACWTARSTERMEELVNYFQPKVERRPRPLVRWTVGPAVMLGPAGVFIGAVVHAVGLRAALPLVVMAMVATAGCLYGVSILSLPDGLPTSSDRPPSSQDEPDPGPEELDEELGEELDEDHEKNS